jgi:uncharacterized protein
MMTIPVEIQRSDIHGLGIFAVEKIGKGKVLWSFTPGLDRSVSDYVIRYGEPKTCQYVKERGYVNPMNPKAWVICVDEAQFWNFPKRGEEANCTLGGVQDGEALILAARDIEPGEELTVPPESDASYEQKMEGR